MKILLVKKSIPFNLLGLLGYFLTGLFYWCWVNSPNQNAEIGFIVPSLYWIMLFFILVFLVLVLIIVLIVEYFIFHTQFKDENRPETSEYKNHFIPILHFLFLLVGSLLAVIFLCFGLFIFVHL